MVDGDGWICLNDGEKDSSEDETEDRKKGLTGRIQFPRMWMWALGRWENAAKG